MATFAAHTALGAGVCAGAGHILGASHEVVIALTVYGAVMGSLPDTLSWLLAKRIGGPTEAEWKETLHDEAPWFLKWQPPYYLHILMDKLFHKAEDPNWKWWAERGYLEITMWYASAILLWLAYR